MATRLGPQQTNLVRDVCHIGVVSEAVAKQSASHAMGQGAMTSELDSTLTSGGPGARLAHASEKTFPSPS